MISELEKVLVDYKIKGYCFDEVVEIKSGKEATVYLVTDKSKSYALKIYKNPEQRAFKNKSAYLAGRFYRKQSIRKAISKNNEFSKKFLHESWVRREYYVLSKLFDNQANIPKVFDWTTNSILMQFIGDDQIAAPRLVDVVLSPDQGKQLLAKVLNSIEIFLDFGIVHGDLSEFNILLWKNEPYIIDFPQAIDIRNNPNKEFALRRDIDNVLKFFGRVTNLDKKEIFSRFGLDDII